jgi:hypothetical protein
MFSATHSSRDINLSFDASPQPPHDDGWRCGARWSESAIGCCRSLGFAPTIEPIPELLALEPEDVHMVLAL